MQGNERFYQQLGQIVADGIPDDWEKAEVHAELDDTAGETKTIYWTKGGDRKQVFLAKKLYPVLQELRNAVKADGQPAWFVLDFRLTPDGKFSIDFGYDKTPWMTV